VWCEGIRDTIARLQAEIEQDRSGQRASWRGADMPALGVTSHKEMINQQGQDSDSPGHEQAVPRGRLCLPSGMAAANI